jgi:hypothetical protein
MNLHWLLAKCGFGVRNSEKDQHAWNLTQPQYIQLMHQERELRGRTPAAVNLLK